MFEKIVLRSSSEGQPVTAGQLAEALLFYRQVHLVLDETSLIGLVSCLGVNTFLEVLKRENLTASFLIGIPAAISHEVGPMSVYGFAFVASAAKNSEPGKKGKKFTYDVLEEKLQRIPISKKDASIVIATLQAKVPRKDLGDDKFAGTLLSKVATDDVLNEEYFRKTVQIILSRSLPAHSIPSEFKIRAQDSDLGFYVFSDLDFHRLETIRRQFAPGAKELSVQSMLAAMFATCTDLAIAARYGGDFVASDLTSQVTRLRYESMLKRADLNRQELEQFQDLVLENCPTLAEAIDAGERSFVEFLELLDRAGRFRQWINGVHPDRGVAKAYLDEITRQEWIQGGPAKTIRYVIGLCAGLPGVDPAVGLGIGLADAFGVDKVLGGWRASHFVDKKLSAFVKPKPGTKD